MDLNIVDETKLMHFWVFFDLYIYLKILDGIPLNCGSFGIFGLSIYRNVLRQFSQFAIFGSIKSTSNSHSYIFKWLNRICYFELLSNSLFFQHDYFVVVILWWPLVFIFQWHSNNFDDASHFFFRRLHEI